MPTIRFRDLVKAAGKPESKSLWTDPKQDRGFMKVVRQNRVLTIIQEPGSKKKEFGEIGFHQAPHANYFVFPKPLPKERAKVIGIKYDLVKDSEPKDAVSLENLRRAPKREKKVSVEKPKLVEKTFDLLVRKVAVIKTKVSVKARNRNEARERALEMVKGQRFDLAKAEVKIEVEK